jgi:hypothetical protein
MIDGAAFIDHPQAMLLDEGFKFGRGDEFFPLMRALRQPAQNIFGPDDGECKAFQRAVQGCHDKQPARTHDMAAGLHEGLHIGDMLDHLHGEHNVETRAGFSQGLDALGPVVDQKTGLGGMKGGRRNIGLPRIEPRDTRPRFGHRFTQQAPATADIDQAQTRQRLIGINPFEMVDSQLAQIRNPCRVEAVQRLHLAVRVPPFGGKPLEAGDFGSIDAGAWHGLWHRHPCHGVAGSLRLLERLYALLRVCSSIPYHNPTGTT